jgi:hypothetical protein
MIAAMLQAERLSEIALGRPLAMTSPPPGGADKRVFSLWPGTAAPERADLGGLPEWAVGSERPVRSSFRPRPADYALWATGGVGVAGLAAAALGSEALELALWLVLLGLIAAAGYALRRHRRRSRSEAAWRDALFERSGISLWREDWTPVGKAIMVLKKGGVHDIQAYFAAHPEEARALRRQVMIKDVNAFTVEMMGARSKADFIGSLDRILPDSDQTFDQWLIAFGRGDAFYRSETHIVRPDGAHLGCLFTAALPSSLEGSGTSSSRRWTSPTTRRCRPVWSPPRPRRPGLRASPPSEP